MAVGLTLTVLIALLAALVVVGLAIPLLEYRRVRAGVRRRVQTYAWPLEHPEAASETGRQLAAGELEADAAALRTVRERAGYGLWALGGLVPSRATLEEVEGRLEFLASGLDAGESPPDVHAELDAIEAALASPL